MKYKCMNRINEHPRPFFFWWGDILKNEAKKRNYNNSSFFFSAVVAVVTLWVFHSAHNERGKAHVHQLCLCFFILTLNLSQLWSQGQCLFSAYSQTRNHRQLESTLNSNHLLQIIKTDQENLHRAVKATMLWLCVCVLITFHHWWTWSP